MSAALPLSLPPPPTPSYSQNQPASFQNYPSRFPSSITYNPSPPFLSSSSSSSSWIETLRSQAHSNRFQEALSTYIEMTSAGIPPDNFAFPAALKSAAALRNLQSGKQLHAAAIKYNYDSTSVTVANSLLSMYGKCGNLSDAYLVFDRIPQRDQVSWNSMIGALCECQEWVLVLDAFRAMQAEGLQPSSFTLVSLLLACSHLGMRDGVWLGKQVHGYGLRTGYFYSDDRTFTTNALMAMYAKLRRVDDSFTLFERFHNCDLVSWNTIISSFAQNDCFVKALALLRRMTLAGVKPDGVTIASVLPACSHFKMLDVGKEIHAFAFRNDNLFENSYVGSALVDMYCTCEQVETGRRVFDGISESRIGLWNAMITGYAQNDLDEEAMRLFIEMQMVSGLYPNPTTMASVLPACVRCKAFTRKEDIHGYVVKRGFESDRYVQNALMDMYSRVGKLEVSEKIFNEMEDSDLVSWNTMIMGYILSGHQDNAFGLLRDMQIGRVARKDDIGIDRKVLYKPNSITLISVLPECAVLALLAKGKEIHAYAIRHELASDVAVGSALVDMYAKAGCLISSRRVFDRMPKRNAITWNVLLMAYGMHGHGEEAVRLFEDMVSEEEVKPNEVTYIALFAACSHSALVSKGLEMFDRMKMDNNIEPTPDHYACVVDLLGRAGKLDEAYQLVMNLPSDACQAGAWSSLLGACRIHGDMKLGEIAAKHLLELEPEVASHYVLLSNIYASAGFWAEALDVRNMMKERGVIKEPGCSWIEDGEKLHKFIAGDGSHPQSAELHSLLEDLMRRMKMEGYTPDTSCVLHNVGDDEKESLLCGHSERLAIAFGILNTPPGVPIRVAKNLRVCNDCHEATKYISKMVGREIIVRDVRRFHHFKDGSCSCQDFW